MESDSSTITFLPAEFIVQYRPGDTVLDAALEHGLDLPHDCGGNCACTTCHIHVESGGESLSPIEPVEDDRLATAANRTRRSRLACQALLSCGPVCVTPQEIW